MVTRKTTVCDICGTESNVQEGKGVLIPLINKRLDLCDDHTKDLKDLFINILGSKSVPDKLRAFLEMEMDNPATSNRQSGQAIRIELCKILSMDREATTMEDIYAELNKRLYHIQKE